MHLDLLLETFGTSWQEVRDGAALAERTGFAGVWVNDHLAGSVQGAPHVLEGWTVLSALAAEVPRITVGPLVLNVANRDPGTLAVMAATLQHLSGGRLLLGLGAGTRPGSLFATEQEALGHPVPADAERRRGVEGTVTTLRRVWSGTVPPAAGFLRPEPAPPIIVAATGPKMADLAGRVGDGLVVPFGSKMTELVALARQARARSGPDQSPLLVAALVSAPPEETPARIGDEVDRLIVYVAPPFDESIARLSQTVNGLRDHERERGSGLRR